MPAASTELRIQETGSGVLCRTILDTLPTWFGVPEAKDDYVAIADASPTIVARVGGDDVGLLTWLTHTPYAAEVHLMAVRPELHRRGIGREMLAHVEERLLATGVEYLQVKTLSASHPDEGYARTRSFYLAMGFRPLEEHATLWGPENPALQLVKRLEPSGPTTRVRTSLGAVDDGSSS